MIETDLKVLKPPVKVPMVLKPVKLLAETAVKVSMVLKPVKLFQF